VLAAGDARNAGKFLWFSRTHIVPVSALVRLKGHFKTFRVVSAVKSHDW